jgi:hypothetical protein
LRHITPPAIFSTTISRVLENNSSLLGGNPMRRAFKRSRQILAYGMKRCLKFAIGMLLLAAFTLWAADTRITLLPKLQAGQTVTYLIRYRSDKNVKTESNVVAPPMPRSSMPTDCYRLKFWMSSKPAAKQRFMRAANF